MIRERLVRSWMRQGPPGRLHAGLLVVGVICLAFGLAACSDANTAPASTATEAVPVQVETVAEQEVIDWDTFTGRFEAIDSVRLRPRVSGYIDAVTFVEGKEVRKGDILFVIDQRPYRVRLQQAQAELASARAQSELAKTELVRTQKLLAMRAVSQEEYDRRASQHSQYLAALQAAQAAVDTAALDLEYTEVAAPIDGRVSRAEVTVGNYVSAGETVLTSVMSLDPVYVVFESDEQTFLRHNARVRQSGLAVRDADTPVRLGFSGDQGFPHAATMNFIDNALNPETGTIRMRAKVANPDQLFTPGMLARVRLQGGDSYSAPVIDERAISTDQDRKYVLVVNDEEVVEYRAVELGGSHGDGRVVRKGLSAGERIIVAGLQRVRPGTPVQAQVVTPQQQVAATR